MDAYEITETTSSSPNSPQPYVLHTGHGNHTYSPNDERKESDTQHSKAAASMQEVTPDPPSHTILTEAEYPEVLAGAYTTRKKWTILSIIFLVQCSMNFNTSLYSNGLLGMSEEFGITVQSARTGAAIFLVTYAFGCELWAPWSEEFGRHRILQLSLCLVNLCCMAAALTPKFTIIIVFRALGGLFSAGGSITLGIVADMYTADTQQYAVAFTALASVGGSIFGPIIGGFVESFMDDWRWCLWLQLIAGVIVQFLHLIFVAETRSTTLLDMHAKFLRRTGTNPNAYGPNERKSWRETMAPKEMFAIWCRPFHMFLTEPIVSILSLLSGFSDAIIFMGFQSFGLVYNLWDFKPWQTGLTFVAIGLGYIISYLSFIPAIRRNIRMREEKPNDEHARFEARLWWMMYTAPCLPIGLFIFAWVSSSSIHWIFAVIATGIIGVANYAVYMATIDFMIAAYGPYAASATGGNGFARDFLAGVLTWYSEPYYDAFKPLTTFHLQWANTVLGLVSLILVASSMAVYFKGASMRKRSAFASKLDEERSQMVEVPKAA